MKEMNKHIIAFTLVAVAVILGLMLDRFYKPNDVYPTEDTLIMLYGESHGDKTYMDLEFELWKGYYDKGYRNLFYELPYYSAQFINYWMKEDSDVLLDEWFEEIDGTQMHTPYNYEFYHKIKEQCPETVFYGTDVGHQFNTTGERYLKFLEDRGLEDTEDYILAQKCIEQGREYREDPDADNGISVIRENYMVDNFIDAYERCGGGKIMGIYGGYHTGLDNPDRMGGKLRARFGDVISSVKMSSVALGERKKPYSFGLSVTGPVFLIMLFVPNIIWGKKGKPEGYDEIAAGENRVLLVFERVGEVLTSATLLIFSSIDPHIRVLSEGVFFEWRVLIWITAFVLMFLYECYWIKYFKSEKKISDMYSSFVGFPVAGATLPVIAVFLLGLYSGNLIIICSAIILGIGHIGIHVQHEKG